MHLQIQSVGMQMGMNLHMSNCLNEHKYNNICPHFQLKIMWWNSHQDLGNKVEAGSTAHASGNLFSYL